MTRNGLVTLGASLASWAILLVVSRATLVATGLDPWLFTLIQMMVAGAVLFALARPEKGTLRILADPFIWLYGVLRVSTAAFFTAALLHTSVANAAFLGVVAVPLSMIVLWQFANRIPARREIPGHIVILTGLALLAHHLEGGWRNPAIILMFLSECCVVVSTIIAEFHPMNRTESIRQRMRLTGIMLLVSACAMLCAAIGLAGLAQWMPFGWSVAPVVPAWFENPGSLLDWRLWATAGLVGLFLRGPSLYLSLAAIHKVRTENYLAGMAALPFLSLVVERIAHWAGWLPPIASPAESLLFGTIIVAGSLWVLFARTRHPQANADRKKTVV